jgi:hypothetical protein
MQRFAIRFCLGLSLGAHFSEQWFRAEGTHVAGGS